MRTYNQGKKGFSIGEMIAVIFIIGIIGVATVPLISVQKTDKSLDNNTVKCVKSELAADLNSTACEKAVLNSKFDKMNAIKTLEHFDNLGTTAEQTAARKVLRQACDEGGEGSCNYIMDSCKKDYKKCDIASSDYDLDYYLKLLVSDNNPGRMKQRYLVKPWYDLGNTNIVAAVKKACCDEATDNTACDISGKFFCPSTFTPTNAGPGASYVSSAKKIIIEEDGDVYVPNTYNSNPALIKLDKYGQELWSIKSGQPYHNTHPGNMVRDSQGYLYALFNRCRLRKYDTAGNLVWAKTYDLLNPKTNDTNPGILFIKNDIIYISSSDSGTPCYLLSVDTDGTLLSQKALPEVHYRQSTDLVVDDSGNLYCIYTGDNQSRAEITKFDSSYNVVWTKEISGIYPEDTQWSINWNIEMSSTGDFFLAGHKSSRAIYVIKMDADGNFLWDKALGYGDGKYIYISSMHRDSSDNLYILGYHKYNDENYNDIFIMKVNTAGELQWMRSIGKEGVHNKGYAIGIDSEDYVYIAAIIDQNDDDSYQRGLIMKLDPEQKSNISIPFLDSILSTIPDDTVVEDPTGNIIIDDLDGWGNPGETKTVVDNDITQEYPDHTVLKGFAGTK